MRQMANRRLIIEYYRSNKQRWEARAEQLRQLADAMPDEIARALMVRIYTNYERLALRAEELGWKACEGDADIMALWDGAEPLITTGNHEPYRPRLTLATRRVVERMSNSD
jgi:hypothetical protein